MAKKINRPWGKTELALAYCDNTMSQRAARNWLMEELRCAPEVMIELRRLGYTDTSKRFSLAQVKVIFHYLGEP